MIINNGLSGAEVVENDRATVTKRGGIVEKTIEQGRWIQEHSSPALPTVLELTNDGYVMERLDHLSYSEVRAEDVVRLLREHVWSKPAAVPASGETYELLRSKVLANIDKSELRSNSGLVTGALFAAESAARSALARPAALAHGDATAENVMRRRGYGPVLIDPIPATLTVPDAPCVDIGKMLQSANGWEAAKYGTDAKAYSVADVRAAVDDDFLFSAGQAWAVVHVIRALPYVMRQAPHALKRVEQVLVDMLATGGFYDEMVL